MSQERLARLECTVCKRVTADTQKNKKKLTNRLELKKFCKWCKKHTLHKETK
ncbi:MAG: 50S ribosomal protein L33 [Parcubacteria group bacterium]|nr:50S ribosomal protein L33 [Parcubacteria group bacterium]